MLAGKKPIRQVAYEAFRPNYHVMNLIGRQIISGYQGYKMLTSIKFHPNGLPSMKNYGRLYPYGIFRGKTPRGGHYKELTPQTIDWKRRKGSLYATQPLRLRPLGDPNALVNNLVVTVYSNNQNMSVSFRNAETDRISRLHETGAKRYHDPESGFTKGNKPNAAPRYVRIPARPHRKVQRAVGPVVRRILQAWLRRHKEG